MGVGESEFVGCFVGWEVGGLAVPPDLVDMGVEGVLDNRGGSELG